MPFGDAFTQLQNAVATPFVVLRTTVGQNYDIATGVATITTQDTLLAGTTVRGYSINEIGTSAGIILAGDREISAPGAQFGGVLPDERSLIIVNGIQQEVIRQWAVTDIGGQFSQVIFHIRGSGA
jgi:hypothetical protein